MPDLRMLLIPHPVQLLDPEQLDALADDIFDRVLKHLQTTP
jgi:hypothetical protein